VHTPPVHGLQEITKEKLALLPTENCQHTKGSPQQRVHVETYFANDQPSKMQTEAQVFKTSELASIGKLQAQKNTQRKKSV
jgi:hypothetical protein